MRWIPLGVLCLLFSAISLGERFHSEDYLPRRPLAETVPTYGTGFGLDPCAPVRPGQNSTSIPPTYSSPSTATASPAPSTAPAPSSEPHSTHSGPFSPGSPDDQVELKPTSLSRAPSASDPSLSAPDPEPEPKVEEEEPVTRGPLSELDHKMATFFKGQKCLNCHGPQATAGRLFDAEGNPLSSDRILDLFEGKTQVPASMRAILEKTRTHLKTNEVDRKNLEAWAKEHGREGISLDDEIPERQRPTVQEPPPSSARKEGEIPQHLDQAIQWGLFSLDDLVEPADFKDKMTRKSKPLVFNIGSLANFLIKDSKMIGPIAGHLVDDPAVAQERIEKLKALAPDKKQEIIIYCGCCDVTMCPNVLGALSKLHELGYSNVKVLKIPIYDESPEWFSSTGLEVIPQ